MPTIKYYIVERQNALTKTLQYYAQKITYSNIGEREIVDYAVQNSNVDRAVIEQVMMGLEEAVVNFLLNGHNLQFWPLGSFFTSISSRSSLSADTFTSANIKGVRINFVPSPMLKSWYRDSSMSFQLDKDYQEAKSFGLNGDEEEGGL